MNARRAGGSWKQVRGRHLTEEEKDMDGLRVEVGKPPANAAGKITLAKWEEWRRAEDKRMLRELGDLIRGLVACSVEDPDEAEDIANIMIHQLAEHQRTIMGPEHRKLRNLKDSGGFL